MFRRVLLVGLASLALAACGTTPPTQEPAMTMPAPLALNVAKIEVVSTFKSSQQTPHVEDQFPITPEQALRDWAKTHLVAAGSSGVARFTILDASVIKANLDQNVGLPGLPRAPQMIAYDATGAATLDMMDAQGKRGGHASARVEFSRTIWPDASPEAHRQLFEGMIAPLVKAFTDEMTASIRGHLGAYLK